jgi:Uncharacterized protein conserved in bacteria (DUF2066)
VLAQIAGVMKARMRDMGIKLKCFLTGLLMTMLCGVALAAGPVETSIFAVQGVDVDVTDTDAALAKNKALIEVQMKAFKTLAERLGNQSLVDAVAKYEEKQVLPFLKSLSIEEESISPGRYKGKLTVRFLPNRIRSLYAGFGVKVGGEQGPSMLILAVWKGPAGEVLWEDNPWHQAWVNLRAEQSLVPIIVPLGDLDDSNMISVTDVLSEDQLKIEAIRRRYDVKKVIIAFAEPAENGAVHARMVGDSPLGKLSFDKIYDGESGRVEESAALAVQRFHDVMVEKFKSGQAKVATQAAEQKRQTEVNARKTITVRVPFAGPSEWNGLRSRILSTPGVTGLDVASLGGDGAVVSLSFVGTTGDMQASMQASGLNLTEAGGGWSIATF